MEIRKEEIQEPNTDSSDRSDLLQRTVVEALEEEFELSMSNFGLEAPNSVEYLYCNETDEAPRDECELSMGNCLRNNSSIANPKNLESCSRSSSSTMDPMPMATQSSLALQSIRPTGVGAGLINIGNTCYINAVLQCFTHTVPLMAGLHSSKHPTPCDRFLKGFCLLCTFRDHVQRSLSTEEYSISPSAFFDNLNFFSCGFSKFEQEDAHEFLQCFLDRLERCFLDSKIGSSSEENLVKRVFGGSLISKLECCDCGYCSETPEPLIDLSLGIEDVDSLTDALASFTKAEKIDDSEPKFQCENCKKEVDVVKQIVVDKAPTVAVFHLKRFKASGLYIEKIGKHVKFPMELDLKSYTVDTSNDDDNVGLKYELYGLVVHSGLTLAYGHYTSFIRSSADKWHSFNDDKVTEVTEEEVFSEKAYILFYAKRGTPWFSDFIEAKKIPLDPETRTESPKSVLDNAENDHAVQSESDITASFGPEVAGCLDKVQCFCIDTCTVTPVIENDKVTTDEVFHPLTPPRPQTPDVFAFESPGPSYIIPRNHLKSEEQPTRKRLLNKIAEDSEKKEARRYIARSMPSDRGRKLMEAIFRPQSEGGAAKKKRKIGSPCKGSSPASVRHKSSHGSVSHPHPVSALLR